MTDTETRLKSCFSAAFPDVAIEEIPTMQATDSDLWDSLATVTLAGLVEEEFDVDVGPEQAKHFVSFASIADFLKPQ